MKQLRLFYFDIQYADRTRQHFYFSSYWEELGDYLYNGDLSGDTLTSGKLEELIRK